MAAFFTPGGRLAFSQQRLLSGIFTPFREACRAPPADAHPCAVIGRITAHIIAQAPPARKACAQKRREILLAMRGGLGYNWIKRLRKTMSGQGPQRAGCAVNRRRRRSFHFPSSRRRAGGARPLQRGEAVALCGKLGGNAESSVPDSGIGGLIFLRRNRA